MRPSLQKIPWEPRRPASRVDPRSQGQADSTHIDGYQAGWVSRYALLSRADLLSEETGERLVHGV